MSSVTTDRRKAVNAGRAIKVACKAASVGALVLTGEQTIDGISCITGDRVLVKNQADQTANGIYEVDTGDWDRAVDFNGNYDAGAGTFVVVIYGSVNAWTMWMLVTTDNPIVIGTSPITFQTIGPGAIGSDSAFISFLQGGIGAVSRTVQDKERESISPLDFMTQSQIADVVSFTGMTDISAPMQKWLDKLMVNGGKGVAPPGAYLGHGLVLSDTDNVSLEGMRARMIYNGLDNGAYLQIGDDAATVINTTVSGFDFVPSDKTKIWDCIRAMSYVTRLFVDNNSFVGDPAATYAPMNALNVIHAAHANCWHIVFTRNYMHRIENGVTGNPGPGTTGFYSFGNDYSHINTRGINTGTCIGVWTNDEYEFCKRAINIGAGRDYEIKGVFESGLEFVGTAGSRCDINIGQTAANVRIIGTRHNGNAVQECAVLFTNQTGYCLIDGMDAVNVATAALVLAGGGASNNIFIERYAGSATLSSGALDIKRNLSLFAQDGGGWTTNADNFAAVVGYPRVKLSNTNPTTITSITNGVAGQSIMLWATNGNSTITHGGSITLRSGAPYVIPANTVYQLFSVDGTNWTD